MPGPTATDLRAVLAYAESTLAVTDAKTIQSVLLPGLAELVRGHAATLHETEVDAPRQVSIGWPRERLTLEVAQRLRPVLLTHPFTRVHRRTLAGDPPRVPFRISDLVTRREWRATPVWAEAMRDTDDQIGVVLARRSGTLRNVLVSRRGRPFTDRERDLVQLAARHVAVAVRRIDTGAAIGLQSMPRAGWVPLGGEVAPARTPDLLSPREQEVLRLVADGLTDGQVARQLGLSPRTVSKHLERVYARLGVPNRAAAVARWSELAG
jgi:DNA-binding CsgD family transcriptional regulator